MSDPTLEQNDRDSNDEEQKSLRPSRHRPRIPEVVPQYPSHQKTQHQPENFFDKKGMPIIATAEEIAPKEDYPFGKLFWLGDLIIFWFMRGKHLWSKSIRNNPVLFYLLGRKTSMRRPDWLVVLFFPLLAVLEFGWLMGKDFLSLSATQLPGGIPNLVTLSTPIVLMGLVALSVGQQFRFFKDKETLQQILLTRITSQEMIYGIVVSILAPFGIGAFLYFITKVLMVFLLLGTYPITFTATIFSSDFPAMVLIELFVSVFKFFSYLLIPMLTIIGLFHHQFSPKNFQTTKHKPPDKIILQGTVGFLLFYSSASLVYFLSEFGIIIFGLFLAVGILMQTSAYNASLKVLQWHFEQPFGWFLNKSDES